MENVFDDARQRRVIDQLMERFWESCRDEDALENDVIAATASLAMSAAASVLHSYILRKDEDTEKLRAWLLSLGDQIKLLAEAPSPEHLLPLLGDGYRRKNSKGEWEEVLTPSGRPS